MYTITKSVAREKLRMSPHLMRPMLRLWRAAASIGETSTLAGPLRTTHEVNDIILYLIL